MGRATLWAESPLLAREETEAVQFCSVAQSCLAL